MSRADMFADELVRVVRADVDADLDRYGWCRSFADLHDACDANEYLLEVGEKVGYPVTDPDWVLGEGAQIEFAAVERVNAEVFGSDQVLRRTYRMLAEYIGGSFPNAADNVGCFHIEWGDTMFIVDRECDNIRVGAYTMVGIEPAEEPHIWVEFDYMVTADQIVAVIEALTDLP